MIPRKTFLTMALFALCIYVIMSNIHHALTLDSYDEEEIIFQTNRNQTKKSFGLGIIEERANEVKALCIKTGQTDKFHTIYRPRDHIREEYFNQTRGKLFFDQITKTIYCPIPKVSSTSWMSLYAEIDSNGIAEKNPHFLHRVLKRRKETAISKKEERYIMNRSNGYLSFLITRHPFERLYSLYMLMLNAHCDLPTLTIYESFLKHYKLNIKTAYGPTGCPIRNITFTELLTYVIADPNFNGHVISMSQYCFPCLFNYDVVLKLENYSKELPILLGTPNFQNNVNKKELVKLNSKTAGNFSHIPMLKVFSTVPCKLLTKLLKVYESDFLLFNYYVQNYFDICNQTTVIS